MRHATTSLPAHLSVAEVTAAESGRSAPQLLDKGTAISKHNRVKAGLQVQGIPVGYRHNVGVLFTPRKPSVKSQQLASVVSKFDSKAIVW